MAGHNPLQISDVKYIQAYNQDAGLKEELLVGGELPSSRGRLVGSPLPAPGCLACHGSGKGGWGPPLTGEVWCRSTEGELRHEKREGR